MSNEWQPIETAPLARGKVFLVIKDCGEETLSSISLAYRLDEQDEWFFADGPVRSLREMGYRLTHWMPLPNPPKQEDLDHFA